MFTKEEDALLGELLYTQLPVRHRDTQEAMSWAAEEIVRLRKSNSDLTSALSSVVSDVLEYEKINGLAPNPGRTCCWDSVTRAEALLMSAV